jgi:hypothetical protein
MTNGPVWPSAVGPPASGIALYGCASIAADVPSNFATPSFGFAGSSRDIQYARSNEKASGTSSDWIVSVARSNGMSRM